MSDTPDVPPSRQQEVLPAEAKDSPRNTPTVELQSPLGREPSLRIDAPPTQDQPRVGATDFALPSPLATDLPPELANHPRYRVVGMLGKGGMGTVFKAEHRVMKRVVALKVIGAHLVANPSAAARFRREVEAAAQLYHPNIVTAYDAEQAGNCHFLVMELVDGISFDLVLQRKGPLPLVFACDYVRQAALGLQHAHEHGMVHRDIKLQNLMLTRKGQVKILDFGLARFARENGSLADNGPTSSLTEYGVLTGTPDFMSPEQAEDAHRADIRADIYSLGCTFYTLLTGQLPFPGGNYVEKVVSHLKKEPAPLSTFRDDLPPPVAQIVGRMMAKDPAQRFQTPDEVAKALLAFRKAGASIVESAPATGKAEEAVPLRALLLEPLPAAADTPASTEGITALPPQPRAESIRTSEEMASPRAAQPRRLRRRKRPLSRRNRRAVVIGAAAGAIGLLGLAALLLAALIWGGGGNKKTELPPRIPSPEGRGEEQGQVKVVSMDPNVQLAIRRGSKVFGTIGPNSHSDATLPAGEYELQIVGGAPEARGFTGRLSLAGGDRKVIEVKREGIFVRDFTTVLPPPPDHPGAPPPPPFGPPRR